MTSKGDLEPQVRCLRLCKSFDGTVALSDATLELVGSQIAAIIGPNGAGKTTLLNVLTGVVRPDSGRCLVNGSVTAGLALHSITKLGAARTFQDVRLIRKASALDNVMLGMPGQRGEALLGALVRVGVADEEAKNRQRSLGLLEFVGLEQSARSPAGELSYGEQKLLSLACCLATDPQVLLLDEPVAGVHPGMVPHILSRLRSLKAEGRLVVFIEHDIAAVREVADLVVVMDGGRVIASGTPSDVLSRPEILEAYVT